MKIVFQIAVLAVMTACTEDTTLRPIPDFPSVEELGEMLQDGETTSEAIVDELIRRAEADSELNAFITLDRENARARAIELDKMRASAEVLGPMHGIPIVVKDNIHVAGLTNTAGTPGLATFVPSMDNAVVESLRNAGAVILGKTNLHELAFGITSDNGAYGAVGNPFDPLAFAGGSSGGTGAAISAGMAPAGLGTDTGGSVRIPAALTGIVGFRPSTGRYDSTAVTPISHTRDTVGLMARSVGDIIMMDRVIVPGELPDSSNIRLGVPRSYYFENLDAQTSAVIEAALKRLGDAGITLVEVGPDRVGDLNEQSAFPIALHEVVRDLPAYLDRYGTAQTFDSVAASAASPDVQGLFGMLGTPEGQIPDEVYESALSARESMRKMFSAYFEDNNLDGLIFPTTLLPARPIEDSLETVELNGEQVPTFPTYIHNTDPASIAGLPGISLPAGLTERGLPVGLEIDGPEGSDKELLAIAQAVERVLGFDARPE